MAKITDIQVQKKNNERISVFLDEKYWTGMSNNCYLKLGIAKGQVVNKKAKAEIEEAVVEDSAFNSALKRLSYGMISEALLAEKLKDKEYNDNVIKMTIEKCVDLALLNDAVYADLLCDSAKRSGRGKSWARQKLNLKKVPASVYEEILEETFPEEDEIDLAREALTKFAKNKLDRREQTRSINKLTRRGFSFEAANKVVGEVSMDDTEEAEIHNAEEAHQLLERKFGTINYDNKNKAYAFLSRRGYLSDVIREAFELAEQS